MNKQIENWINNNLKPIINETIKKELVSEMSYQQDERFHNQGQLNNHDRWEDNAPSTIKRKGINSPNVDSSQLFEEVKDKTQWDSAMQLNNDTLFAPDEIDWADPIYQYTNATRNFSNVDDKDYEVAIDEVVKNLPNALQDKIK